MAKKKKEIEEEVKASEKKGKKKEAPAKKEKKAKSKPAPEKKPKASGDDGWDEQTGGGGDFFKLPVGETEVLNPYPFCHLHGTMLPYLQQQA